MSNLNEQQFGRQSRFPCHEEVVGVSRREAFHQGRGTFDLPIGPMFSNDYEDIVDPADLHEQYQQERGEGTADYMPYRDMVESIRTEGVRVPLEVIAHSEHGMALREGHHRLAAAHAAGLKAVPARWTKLEEDE